jgi:Holliday junction resolvase RusA-like endonuclease
LLHIQFDQRLAAAKLKAGSMTIEEFVDRLDDLLLAPPFTAPVEVVLDLPFPPSANRLHRIRLSGRKHKRSLTNEYKQWRVDCDIAIALDRSYPRGRKIETLFEAIILLDGAEPHRGDLDNKIKAVLDYAQSRELIVNDKFCQRITAEWTQTAHDVPRGCRLILRSWNQ